MLQNRIHLVDLPIKAYISANPHKKTHALEQCPNNRIQITLDRLIYFYYIDQKTLMPVLENCMYNFMGCNQLMFGSKVRYGISYKQNQKSFEIFRRKYMHNLKVCVNDEDFSGSQALELVSMNTFLVSKVDKVLMFDCDTF